MAENSEVGILNACSSNFVSPKKRKIQALNAGYHSISLLHLRPPWNVLFLARGDGDRSELRNV